jgi:hypothetical protein
MTVSIVAERAVGQAYGCSLGVGVEDLAVLELADVTHTDLGSRLGSGSISLLRVGDGETSSERLGSSLVKGTNGKTTHVSFSLYQQRMGG